MLTLALPSLAVLKPQLSSDVFRAEWKLGRFAASAVHSRTMQQLDATVAVMKHTLDAQLVVRLPCKYGPSHGANPRCSACVRTAQSGRAVDVVAASQHWFIGQVEVPVHCVV